MTLSILARFMFVVIDLAQQFELEGGNKTKKRSTKQKQIAMEIFLPFLPL